MYTIVNKRSDNPRGMRLGRTKTCFKTASAGSNSIRRAQNRAETQAETPSTVPAMNQNSAFPVVYCSIVLNTRGASMPTAPSIKESADKTRPVPVCRCCRVGAAGVNMKGGCQQLIETSNWASDGALVSCPLPPPRQQYAGSSS
jgi:hypothetical protein